MGLALVLAAMSLAVQAQDPLPSWNEGAAKASTTEFVTAVTTEGGKDFVAPADRVATFDNDGTLWSEQPLYFQFVFMLDQLKAAAPQHPEWKDNAAFKALVAHDRKALAAMGHKPILELLAVANSGMTVGAYDRQSSIGKLDQAWDEAIAKGWVVVSMKSDWKKIFAFE